MQTDPAPTTTIASTGLVAEIAARGAELVRLQDSEGRDLLWSGDPAFWNGRSPLLFPIVGRLKDDHLKVGGVDYPMRQHGIARTSTFERVAREATLCRMQLRSDEATRAAYPFDFALEVTYRVDGPTLAIDVVARNHGDRPMPASMGFHPAFNWPLPYGADRAAHEVVFDKPEPGPLRSVVGGLLSPEMLPSPVQGRRLQLTDGLFDADALIFLGQASRSVRFGPLGGRGLRIDFPNMPDLGIWTKPGAPFLCIEPWSGYASPADFDGEFAQKPGLISVPPGEEANFGMTVTLDPA